MGLWLGAWLFRFSPEPRYAAGWMVIHRLLVLLLLVMLPLGKMSHFISQFFLKFRINWVDW